MAKIYRNEVASFLRSQKFTVSTAPNLLSFNNYSLQFDDSLEYVTVFNPYAPAFNAKIPYCSPPKLLDKIRLYFSMQIPPCYQYKALLGKHSNQFTTSRKPLTEAEFLAKKANPSYLINQSFY